MPSRVTVSADRCLSGRAPDRAGLTASRRISEVINVRFRALLGLLLTVILVGSSGLFSPTPAAAQTWSPPTKVYLSKTGHTVDGLFLNAWREHAPYFGNPISEELSTKAALNGKTKSTVTVQYFENVALAYTPKDERGSDWQVQALPLGVGTLKTDQQNPRFTKLAADGSCGKLAETDCHRFSSTGHTVKWGMLTYWKANGGDQLIGAPITEEFVSDNGSTVQYFERAVLQWKKDKGVTPRAIGKEAAKLLKIDTKKIDQPEDAPTYDEALFTAPEQPEQSLGVGGIDLGYGPGPQQGGEKEIVVSLTQEAMWAYENDELVLSTLVSTGVAHSAQSTTPVGYFSILTKYDSQTMSGVIDDEAYNVPDVPWVMYFDDLGDALHGTYWHNNFGTPMSHGCVNQPMDVAEFMYSWAPIGTPVTVLA
jgi:hypothetical protein